MRQKNKRKSGILLHPTSLPGAFGVGTLGDSARAFVDFLASSGQTLWQVMPLGPTSYGDSPYQSPSAFAGNPLLISLEELVKENLLSPEDLNAAPGFPQERVDFGALIPWKMGVLRRSFARFQEHASASQRTDFGNFGAVHHAWLNDYALFAALKEAHGGEAWNTWAPELARREPEALHAAEARLSDSIRFYTYLQFLFAKQWEALKGHANEHKVEIVGDIPIFVAYDSADVWANPGLFFLQDDLRPSVVAGVPPDYFSATGQLWGNPLYRWEVMAKEGYSWWVERFRVLFSRVDIARLDHFRGFSAYWEIPAGEKTAIKGRWVSGPGRALFDKVFAELGTLPIIAEDLGIITPDVERLRDSLGFPGMKVLQFAFGGDPSAAYLPHHFSPHCVVYTGTHDNDTTRGWWEAASAAERKHVEEYLGFFPKEVSWELIRLALGSVAGMAIFPLQDVLGLGSEARMNTPSRASGNWSWRCTPEMLREEIAARLRLLSYHYSRAEREPG